MSISLLTTKEVADRLKCSTNHVLNLRKAGLLRGTRFAKRWMYAEEEVDAFISANLGKDLNNFMDLTDEARLEKYGHEPVIIEGLRTRF